MNNERLAEDGDVVNKGGKDEFSNDQYDSDVLNMYGNEEDNEGFDVEVDNYHR